MKKTMAVVCMAASMVALAQGKEDFMRQQAYAEMQRVSGQIDVLQSNLNDLQQRIGRLEGNGDAQGIRQEIASLKAAIADIRREMQNQRGEIVKDLSGRIAKMQPPATQPPAPKQVVIGPHSEYVVQSGDTLSLISQAFNVPVKKIREMNNLKNDNLRIGQKLNLPKQ